jgi:hypothetical protein
MFVKLGPALANSRHTMQTPGNAKSGAHLLKKLSLPLSSDDLFLRLDCLRFFFAGLLAVLLLVLVAVLL